MQRQLKMENYQENKGIKTKEELTENIWTYKKEGIHEIMISYNQWKKTDKEGKHMQWKKEMFKKKRIKHFCDKNQIKRNKNK